MTEHWGRGVGHNVLNTVLDTLLKPSWGHLGPSWGHLGAIWGHLGPRFGSFWALDCALIKLMTEHWGRGVGHNVLKTVLDTLLRPSWGHLGPSWAVLGIRTATRKQPQKRPENNPKTIQNETRKRPENDPKAAQKRPANEPN